MVCIGMSMVVKPLVCDSICMHDQGRDQGGDAMWASDFLKCSSQAGTKRVQVCRLIAEFVGKWPRAANLHV